MKKQKIPLERLLQLEAEGHGDRAIGEHLGATTRSVTNARYRFRRAGRYSGLRRWSARGAPAGKDVVGLVAFYQAAKMPGQPRRTLRVRTDLLDQAERQAATQGISLSQWLDQAIATALAKE